VSVDSLETKEVDCKESELLDIAYRFRVETSSHDDVEYLRELSQQLSNYLIYPVTDYISKAELIYFVPYGITLCPITCIGIK